MSELNQIEEIEKLYAKPKTYPIPKKPKEGQKQAKLNVIPLDLDQLGLMGLEKDATSEEISKNAHELFSVSLGITKEQVGKLSTEFMDDLMDAILDANNFSKKDLERTGVKKFLETKRKQIKDQKEKVDGNGSVKSTQE